MELAALEGAKHLCLVFKNQWDPNSQKYDAVALTACLLCEKCRNTCTGSKPYHFACSFPCSGCVSFGPVGISAFRLYRGIHITLSVRGDSIKLISRAPNYRAGA